MCSCRPKLVQYDRVYASITAGCFTTQYRKDVITKLDFTASPPLFKVSSTLFRMRIENTHDVKMICGFRGQCNFSFSVYVPSERLFTLALIYVAIVRDEFHATPRNPI